MSKSAKPYDTRIPILQPDRPDTDNLRRLGGSKRDTFNLQVFRGVLGTLWTPPDQSEEQRHKQFEAASVAMTAFKPTDEIEAMIAAQAIAQHNTAMECARRAMLPEQPHEAAQAHRKASANASRAFTELLTALDRKRGKGGQQKVTVEHVHVHAGGQAIVGHVEAGGRGGGVIGSQGEPGASAAPLAHDAAACTGSTPVRRTNAKRQAMPVSRDAERTMPDARRQIDGAADG